MSRVWAPYAAIYTGYATIGGSIYKPSKSEQVEYLFLSQPVVQVNWGLIEAGMMKTRLAAAELCACFVYLSSSGSFLLISPFNNCKRIYIVSLFIEERLPRNNVDERYCSKGGGREKKESSCIHLQRSVTVVVTIYIRLNAGLSHGLSMLTWRFHRQLTIRHASLGVPAASERKRSRKRGGFR